MPDGQTPFIGINVILYRNPTTFNYFTYLLWMHPAKRFKVIPQTLVQITPGPPEATSVPSTATHDQGGPMARERLYFIHGIGPDAVGLIGKITQEIAKYNGNVIDLHQDVLHGLFIIYAVVDLSGSPVRIDEFNAIIARLSEDTGITLSVSNYNPVPRNAEKKNMLCILVGTDTVGIISSMSQLLSKYAINIEFARNIGREGVFLMELMTDISDCTIPIENVQRTVSSAMEQIGIKTMYQTDDVFNRKKRVILFDITLNMIDDQQRSELVNQAGIDEHDLDSLLADATGASIARRLEGVPLATYESIIDNVHATSDTVELLQTLKTMGYTIGLITSASDLFARSLASRLGIDLSLGIPYESDDDARTFSGSIDGGFEGIDRQQIITSVVAKLGITRDDITIIEAGHGPHLPGVHPVFNMGIMLGLYNRHSVSREQLAAIIASFGTAGSSGK